jgi:hypothetical protein
MASAGGALFSLSWPFLSSWGALFLRPTAEFLEAATTTHVYFGQPKPTIPGSFGHDKLPHQATAEPRCELAKVEDEGTMGVG